jgi:hypothetical protein
MTTARYTEALEAFQKIETRFKERLEANNPEALGFIASLRTGLGLIKDADELTPADVMTMKVEFDKLDVMYKDLTKAGQELPPEPRQRRAWLYWCLDEFANHSKYREILQTASSMDEKQRQQSKSPVKLPKHFFKIERIFAKAGAVHMQNKDGRVHMLPVKEACSRGILLQEWLRDSNVPEWHKKRIRNLLEQLVKACMEARRQLTDPENREAGLIREVFQGTDAEGKPVEIVVDEATVHQLHKMYFTVSEDEIVQTLKQVMPIGLHSYKARTELLKRLHEARCTDQQREAYPVNV